MEGRALLRPGTEARPTGLRWALLGVLVVVGLTVAGVFLSRLGEPAAALRVQPVFRQITFEPGVQYQPSLSPDGEQLVYTDGTDLLLRRVDGTDVVVLTEELEPAASGPRWSPDGERIAFEGGGDLYVVGALGGRPRKVTEGGYRPSWSPGGDQLAFTTHDLQPPFVVTSDDGELWTVGVKDGELRRIQADRNALMPDWSPTGERIVFVAPEDGWLKLWTVRPDGSSLSRVLDQEAWAPRWSRDGRTLYFLASRGDTTAIHEVAVDPATGAGLGAPVVVATVPAGRAVDLAPAGAGDRWAVTASLDSTHLYSLSLDPETGAAIGPLRAVTSGGRRFGGPAFSPDGQQLAFTSMGQSENLYLAAADGSGMRALSAGQTYTRGPAFHPTEPSRIAFFGARDGRNGIWTVDGGGGGLTRLSGDAVSDPNMPLWSPDGTRMAFNDSLTRAHVVELGRRWDPQLSGEGASSPDGWFVTSWSADGRWLAACSIEQGTGRMDPGTGEVELLDQEGYFAAWMPDSRSMIVGRWDELIVVDTETLEARLLVSLAPGHLPGSPSLAVSPDGSTVVVSVDHSDMDVWVADFVPES
jgi:tricorn protease